MVLVVDIGFLADSLKNQIAHGEACTSHIAGACSDVEQEQQFRARQVGSENSSIEFGNVCFGLGDEFQDVVPVSKVAADIGLVLASESHVCRPSKINWLHPRLFLLTLSYQTLM